MVAQEGDLSTFSRSTVWLVYHGTVGNKWRQSVQKDRASVMFPATVKSLWVANVEQHFVITFIVSLTHLSGSQYIGIVCSVWWWFYIKSVCVCVCVCVCGVWRKRRRCVCVCIGGGSSQSMSLTFFFFFKDWLGYTHRDTTYPVAMATLGAWRRKKKKRSSGTDDLIPIGETNHSSLSSSVSAVKVCVCVCVCVCAANWTGPSCRCGWFPVLITLIALHVDFFYCLPPQDGVSRWRWYLCCV